LLVPGKALQELEGTWPAWMAVGARQSARRCARDIERMVDQVLAGVFDAVEY
jgi:hypothetical protein